MTCQQERRAQPAFHSTFIEVQASLKASEKWMITMMDRISHRDDQNGIPMIEIGNSLFDMS